MGTNLAKRVEANAATRTNPDQPMSVYQLIESQKAEIARALPKHMDADRLARIAITVIKQTPALGNCEPLSLIGALMTASQLGLEPGPLGESYLVPFGRQVTFIPGYRGLIKLAWQSGQLETINAHVVYENDEFDYQFGLDATLTHKPARGERGTPTEVYAVVKFKDGGHAFEVMSVNDVEKIRSRSRAAKNGPWVSDWDAMAKKTVIKQLMKFVPLSPELRDVATAAALDGSTRTDITGPVGELVPSDIIDGEVVDTTTGEITSTAAVTDDGMDDADRAAQAEFEAERERQSSALFAGNSGGTAG